MPLERPAWARGPAANAPKRPAAEMQGEREELRALLKKARAAGGDDDVKQKFILAAVMLLLRVSATNMQALREITGSVYRTFLIAASNPIAKCMLDGGSKYHQKTLDIKDTYKEDAAQKRKELENLGPPFVHIWVDLLEHLIESEKTPQPSKAVLKTYWGERVLQAPLMELCDEVRICMIRKTHSTDTQKIHLRFEDREVEKAVISAISHGGGSLKHGPAPKSAMEREVQQLLDAMEGEDKDARA